MFQGEETPPAVEDRIKQVSDKAASDVSKALEGLKNGDWEAAWPLISDYAIPAVGALLALIIGYMVAKLLARIISAPVRKRVDETLGRFVGKMVYYSVMTCIVIAVLSTVGIEVASFAAILAAAGFAIGMAFQGTLGNFASGIMLLVFRPFKVGDVVSAAGVTAKINEIDLFTTTMDTPDNRRIIVPNSAIASGTIENLSHHEERRVDVAVGTDYSADLRQTREVLEQAATALQSQMVAGDGRGYQVVLGTLGDSCVNWTVRFWTKAENYWPVTEALTESVKNHLDDAGIGIPFPQLDIHVPDASVSMSPGQ
ncbi:MAG: mechanosensitive ion channel [Planctomycetaceae bacterium]|nr:mechanosensitive ion channel [Planctomycetaceae bacterium]